ncbi:aminotransferase class I/II-fold pyridoxal phosphate-dependent enzyme [Fulvimarina endophytica]|uniref:Histidinol-phosphate aminotransferase n=2 Tax=Fulvimarina endophytica TaxID=2293836 RepID=A0A371WZ62_9HYPH|nr:aminotransferase class I/II-fold pyridoxal phosphate-dependent enzyme [Fulvimarina endophytica]
MNIALARKASGRDDIARLASNENPDGCSPRVLAALADPALEPWRYADPACTALRAALGETFGVDAETIVVGNGSEEMIAAISRAALVPGAGVLTVVPSFGLHEIEPMAQGASVTKIAMTEDLGFDIDALERALADEPAVFFLSSPWNPVGTGLDRSSLQRLLRATRQGTLFVLDEAYVEYADEDAPDGLALLRESGASFVSLRTFSKAFGLAGLRVGYAICSDTRIARAVSAAKTPFNVNAAAQTAALAALGDMDWMRESVGRRRIERERVSAALTALGFRPAPSQTNSVFFDCGTDSADLAAAMLKQGIVIKAWREMGYERFVRVTIGTEAENDRFLTVLRSLQAASSDRETHAG